jgi:alpha/beta superfamily hydrolase
MTRRAVTSTRVEIPGPAGQLELAVDQAGTSAAAVAVICHPHPLQQGTMHNKVVTTLARTFANLGAAAVRFNFRGVGDSAGAYADGVGERDDAAAVVEFARERWAGLPVYLGGFSFGGAVALGIASRIAPRGLVTVAPPVARLGAEFVPPRCPWLLLHGSDDDVVPAGPVIEWATALAAPPRVVQLAGVGHFFHGHLNALSAAVTEFFAADFGVLA